MGLLALMVMSSGPEFFQFAAENRPTCRQNQRRLVSRYFTVNPDAILSLTRSLSLGLNSGVHGRGASQHWSPFFGKRTTKPEFVVLSTRTAVGGVEYRSESE
jgi:hypothetical protein